MSTNDLQNVTSDLHGNETAGDAVMRAIGKLDEAANQLNASHTADETDPETIGHWITVIGKALLAIFKP